MKRVIILIIVAVALLTAVRVFGQSHLTDIKIGETALRVWVADTDKARAQGLSGKSFMGDDQGMLFIFDKPGQYGFWMKQMSFPIDIIWLNENKEIVGVEKSVDPSSYPEVFYPGSGVKYVLETASGFSDLHDLKVGQSLSLGH